MCAAEAENLMGGVTDESSAMWGVRVLLAGAVARALRAGTDREAIRRVFEAVLQPETREEGDADV